MDLKGMLNTVKTGTKDTIEITKLKAKATKEKSDIKETYGKIGEYIYNNYKELGIEDEKILSFIEGIDAAKGRIKDLHSQIDEVKMK